MPDRQRHQQEGVLLYHLQVVDLLRRRQGLACSHNCLAPLPRTAINFQIPAMLHGNSNINEMRWHRINRCRPFKTTRSTR